MKNFKTILLTLPLLLLIACGPPKDNNQKSSGPVRIAISKAVPIESYKNYIRWIHHADSLAEYVEMYHLELDSALALFSTCDGLLLTGGTDIYPGNYGKEYDTSRCWEPDFKRDTLEAALLHAALDKNMPVMGICRGLQMINVELGGTLIVDIPSDLDTIVKHQVPGSYDAMHKVVIDKNSLLHTISGTSTGITNSNHHQGIERLAPGLMAVAFTEDGLTESIQLVDTNKQFLLGVQWHPERMEYSSTMSGTLARRFLEEVHTYKLKK